VANHPGQVEFSGLSPDLLAIGRRRAAIEPAPPGRLIATRDVALGLLLVMPAGLLVFGMILYPFVYELGLSLTSARAAEDGAFVGLANYVELIQSGEFWQAAGNTLIYVGATTALKLAFGMVMALALARPFTGRSLVLVLLLLPWLFPAALSTTALYWLLNPLVESGNGLVPRLSLLSPSLGMTVEGIWPMARVIGIDTWRGTSFFGVYLLVGLNAVPAELFEWARLEGASGWRRFRMVTLPLLRPTMLLATLLSISFTLGDFTNLYLVSGGRETLHVIGTLAYDTALTIGETGYGAAIALSLLPLVVGATLFLLSQLDRARTT
jgi:ABC-type sugar transport system permease subunit